MNFSPPAIAVAAKPDVDPRIAELRRMRTLATSLLLMMAAIFVATRLFEGRWHWLAYVRAFAEASMVGACADWFAVVALFRHPLGIPIPHTAIVTHNKARIADAIGGFISRNFLEPSVVSARLASVDAVDWWLRQLARPESAAHLAQRTVGFLAPFIELTARPSIHAYLRDATRRGLLSVPAAPFAARILSILLDSGKLIEIAEQAIAFADAALNRNDDLIRSKVSESSSWWIPKWVDGKLADRVLSGARSSLAELRSPNHPWRGQFAEYVKQLVERLARDPEMVAAAERLQMQLFDNPTVAEWLDILWHGIESRLKEDVGRNAGFIQGQLEQVLAASARLLADDDHLRDAVNEWIRHTIEVTVVPYRAEIGTFIADVVKRWGNSTLVGKMELTFGTDLQYVRINGTLVGGLVGLLIYTASELATSLMR